MATTRQHHCIWTGARDTLHTGRGRKESESDTWRRAVLGCMSWCLSGMQMAAQLQLQLLHIEPGKKLVIREESKASRCKAAAGFRRGDADAPLPVSVVDTCSTHPEIKNIACSARPSWREYNFQFSSSFSIRNAMRRVAQSNLWCICYIYQKKNFWCVVRCRFKAHAQYRSPFDYSYT